METETVIDVNSEVLDEQKVDEPRLWRVLLHNDNVTTMEFVVQLLVQVFHKEVAEAMAIMLDVHEKGKGQAGIYTHDIAESKMEISIQTARQYGFPLRVTIEQDE